MLRFPALGLQFLSATITEVSPTHLIQLSVEEDSYRNFPLMTVFKVGTHSLFLTAHQIRTVSWRQKLQAPREIAVVVVRTIPYNWSNNYMYIVGY